MIVELGDKVKDSVTGFAGIAIAKIEWLHGCIRVTVQPDKLGGDGKPLDVETFDEPQLIVTKAAKVKSGANRDRGGPIPNPVQKGSPKR